MEPKPSVNIQTAVVGLRHVHLKVANVALATAFYESAFNFRVGHRVHDGAMVFLQTIGGDDLLTLSAAAVPSEVDGRTDSRIGNSGGVDHFGVCVADAEAFRAVVAQVAGAGGVIVSEGAVYGAPTAFVRDVDGYAIQVYVMPTVEQ
jgi:catechol 2,3-dioxygenase-like lactoylglutathione lyase family enzyme